MNFNFSLMPPVFWAITAAIFIWLAALSIIFYRILSHYQQLTRGVTKKDLKSILENLLGNFEKESEKVNQLIKELKDLKQDNLYNIQKIGLVRFNPFAGTGGNQSFCLSLLDGDDSGLVISSLHTRETTRIYVKPARKGKAVGYDFSNEEKQAVKQAKRIK